MPPSSEEVLESKGRKENVSGGRDSSNPIVLHESMPVSALHLGSVEIYYPTAKLCKMLKDMELICPISWNHALECIVPSVVFADLRIPDVSLSFLLHTVSKNKTMRKPRNFFLTVSQRLLCVSLQCFNSWYSCPPHPPSPLPSTETLLKNLTSQPLKFFHMLQTDHYSLWVKQSLLFKQTMCQ